MAVTQAEYQDYLMGLVAEGLADSCGEAESVIANAIAARVADGVLGGICGDTHRAKVTIKSLNDSGPVTLYLRGEITPIDITDPDELTYSFEVVYHAVRITNPTTIRFTLSSLEVVPV